MCWMAAIPIAAAIGGALLSRNQSQHNISDMRGLAGNNAVGSTGTQAPALQAPQTPDQAAVRAAPIAASQDYSGTLLTGGGGVDTSKQKTANTLLGG